MDNSLQDFELSSTHSDDADHINNDIFDGNEDLESALKK